MIEGLRRNRAIITVLVIFFSTNGFGSYLLGPSVCNDGWEIPGLDSRTTRHASYEMSQRKLIEQKFGWGKQIGRKKTEVHAFIATYNLVRIIRLTEPLPV